MKSPECTCGSIIRNLHTHDCEIMSVHVQHERLVSLLAARTQQLQPITQQEFRDVLTNHAEDLSDILDIIVEHVPPPVSYKLIHCLTKKLESVKEQLSQH